MMRYGLKPSKSFVNLPAVKRILISTITAARLNRNVITRGTYRARKGLNTFSKTNHAARYHYDLQKRCTAPCKRRDSQGGASVNLKLSFAEFRAHLRAGPHSAELSEAEF